jgi:hypothetical protein
LDRCVCERGGTNTQQKMLRGAMPWSHKLTKPIVLKDGRTIATLGQAREMMLSIPIDRRRGEMWRYIAELLNEAARDSTASAHVETEAQLIRALKAEGLFSRQCGRRCHALSRRGARRSARLRTGEQSKLGRRWLLIRILASPLWMTVGPRAGDEPAARASLPRQYHGRLDGPPRAAMVLL